MIEKLPRNLKSGSADREKKFEEAAGIARYADSVLPVGSDYELSEEHRLELKKTLENIRSNRLDAVSRFPESVDEKKISDKLAVKLSEFTVGSDRTNG